MGTCLVCLDSRQSPSTGSVSQVEDMLKIEFGKNNSAAKNV